MNRVLPSSQLSGHRFSAPILIEGPFESDYSLAIVNRYLAIALHGLGCPVKLHQRDNTTHYEPSIRFLNANATLAPLFVSHPFGDLRGTIHSRYIYPPFTDGMGRGIRAFHCYGWEESGFPRKYVNLFNRDLDLITVMSNYVKRLLQDNGVHVAVEVVGLGADHILNEPPAAVEFLKADRFNFLHVSSCFPRKGADVLVDAFCEEFDRGENVALIVKTFPNPHSSIDALVKEFCERHPRHAPLEIVDSPLSLGEMRFLMERADCLVAPSRGEGFGLPVAEAMLLGRPVIATIHGGHADLCSPEWSWPVEFSPSRRRRTSLPAMPTILRRMRLASRPFLYGPNHRRSL